MKEPRTENIKDNNGFTLIEVLVALSVFVTAVGLIVGVFTQALRTQRMVSTLSAVNSNASLVLEQITREIRLGWNFTVAPNLAFSPCAVGQSDNIHFFRSRSTGPTEITYHWGEADHTINRGEGGASPEPLTAANVDVNRLCFRVFQEEINHPWRITIFTTVGSHEPQLQSRLIDIQTTVSSRVLPEDVQ